MTPRRDRQPSAQPPVRRRTGGRSVAAAVGLDGWYADPLPPEQAGSLLRGRGGRRAGPVPAEAPLAAELNELVGRFWLGRSTTSHYYTLRAAADGPGLALVELVQGQLLMSRRLEGARRHLYTGFELARPWLSARAYFTLLKRHQLLARLPLSASGEPPRTLPELLLEARIVARLEGYPSRTHLGLGHCDTVG